MGSTKVLSRPEVVVESRATVGEGPVWDPRTGRLCWVDIVDGILFEDDLASGEQRRSALGMTLGAAVPRATEEGFAVAVADGFGVFRAGALRVGDHVLPDRFRRMNDAKCDSQGRLWAGSTHVDFKTGAGALHRWDGAARSRVVASGFSLPNGIGWSPSDTTMYLVDSVSRAVLSADFRSEDGRVGVFAPAFEVEGGLPDGMAVDLDGCLWIAIWGGAEVRRYSPEGELLAHVPMPVEQPTSCCFGDDGTLYITSASAGITEGDRVTQPLAGSVFAVSTNTRGVPIRSFAG